MFKLQIKQLSSLEKVFLNAEPQGKEISSLQAVLGGEASYQIAFSCMQEGEYLPQDFTWALESPLQAWISIYRVGQVPSALPAYPERVDSQYLSTQPGLFPDPLFPVQSNEIEAFPGRWQTLWISIRIPAGIPAGKYPIRFFFTQGDFTVGTATMQLDILPITLEKQTLIYTQWLHVDCIADIHTVPIYSEAHWRLIEQYIRMAAEHGVNMLLTPVLTPPLDTKIGGQRPTTQLVDIHIINGSYQFGWDKLARFVRTAQSCGIQYFEISHLFTQWGAHAAPKVMAKVKGKQTQLFGWDTPAQSPAYAEFLQSFLPALVSFFTKMGLQDKIFFHVSDEPSAEDIPSYRAAAEMVAGLLKGYPIIDALSDIAYWKDGLVKNPVVSTDHIQPFLEETTVDNLWCYYCGGQCQHVSNRFFAMPSKRTRILGVQLYTGNIRGFLHWGYNFYYTRLSKHIIDPYHITDAGESFPSGDAFSVYPYRDTVIPSIRLKVFYEALQDLQLLRQLEHAIGRPAVESLLQDTAGQPITFQYCPDSPDFYLHLREMMISHLLKT